MFFTTGVQLQAAISALPAEKTGITVANPAGFVAFDPFFYGQQYMSAGKYSGTLSPIEHFVQIGAAQGNKPSAAFDPVFYASKYPDLNGKGFDSADLLIHFLRTGLDEGRVPNASLADFNGAAYLAAYPDVATYVNANLSSFGGSANNGAIAHYVKFGQFQGFVATDALVSSYDLSTGFDSLTGSGLDEVFNAGVVQNSQGEQTNQLATGDKIVGGLGIDSLVAVVQKASALNNAPSQAITPVTTSVEKATFTALTVNNNGAIDANETVVINAKSMTGLTKVSSVQSDASLTIQNLTTLSDARLAGNTEVVTIRMDHTGNDRALDQQSNMTVLFDNDYLLSGRTSQSEALYYLLDEAAELAGNANRLQRINVDGIRFTTTKDGVTSGVIALRDNATWLLENVMVSHASFVASLQNELVALIAAGTLPVGTTLTVDPTRTDVTGLDTGALSGAIPAIVLKTIDGTTVTPVGFSQVADALGQYDVYGQFGNQAAQAANPVVSKIELEKVGRGAEGGDLTVGGMATDLANNWDYSTSALKEGVEQFEVSVSGDNTQFSDLASLQSTNNTLTTVNVGWATGSVADLTIGNHNTAGTTPNGADGNAVFAAVNKTTALNNAFKDVRVFTATNNNSVAGINGTSITNDVTLHAHVSDQSVAKYMNRVDNGVNPVNDNANFVYTFGNGNDTLNLNISKANLAASGTTNREDFSFAIASGVGNDTVTTQIGDATGVAADAWFINSELNDNLSISAGAGDDTISTYGAGSWNVDLGIGNDAAYSDNSGALVLGSAVVTFDNTGGLDPAIFEAGDLVTGVSGEAVSFNSGRATWVLNTRVQESNGVTGTNADLNIANLTSGANTGSTVATAVSYYKSTLTVSLAGVTATVVVDDYSTTDLELNNLIKAAIKGNEHLRDLIVAEDGPANTLVVRSLVDGVFAAGELTVTIAANAITAMATDQIALYNAANGTTFTTAAAVSADVAADVTAFVARTDYDAALATQAGVLVGQAFGATTFLNLTGADSTAATASTFVDGTGNDTIVLSTSGLVRETVTLTADAQKDVIFNATNVTINGLGLEDQVVLGTGTSLTATTAWNFLGGTAANDTISGDANVNYIWGYAGADTLSGLAGNDVIDGGAGADTITGGVGVDTLTGGTDVANTFAFVAGDSGLPSATNFDTITDFSGIAGNVISLAAASIGVNAGAAAAGVASIAASGQATFFGTDSTLALHLIAVEGGINAGGVAAAGQSAMWQEGADAYVFVSDGVDGIGANDILIKLVGVNTGLAAFDTLTDGGTTFTIA